MYWSNKGNIWRGKKIQSVGRFYGWFGTSHNSYLFHHNLWVVTCRHSCGFPFHALPSPVHRSVFLPDFLSVSTLPSLPFLSCSHRATCGGSVLRNRTASLENEFCSWALSILFNEFKQKKMWVKIEFFLGFLNTEMKKNYVLFEKI